MSPFSLESDAEFMKNVPNYFLMILAHFLCFPFLQHLLSRIWIFWIFPEILCFLHYFRTILYCLIFGEIFLSPTFRFFVFLHFHSHLNWQRNLLLFLNICIYVYTHTHTYWMLFSACSICFWILWNINYSSYVVFWVFFFIKINFCFLYVYLC